MHQAAIAPDSLERTRLATVDRFKRGAASAREGAEIVSS
jgi:hypothetical protein